MSHTLYLLPLCNSTSRHTSFTAINKRCQFLGSYFYMLIFFYKTSNVITVNQILFNGNIDRFFLDVILQFPSRLTYFMKNGASVTWLDYIWTSYCCHVIYYTFIHWFPRMWNMAFSRKHCRIWLVSVLYHWYSECESGSFPIWLLSQSRPQFWLQWFLLIANTHFKVIKVCTFFVRSWLIYDILHRKSGAYTNKSKNFSTCEQVTSIYRHNLTIFPTKVIIISIIMEYSKI